MTYCAASGLASHAIDTLDGVSTVTARSAATASAGHHTQRSSARERMRRARAGDPQRDGSSGVKVIVDLPQLGDRDADPLTDAPAPRHRKIDPLCRALLVAGVVRADARRESAAVVQLAEVHAEEGGDDE